MKKKKIIMICIGVLVLAMIIPISSKLKDGGSTEYKSLLYKITKIHRLNNESTTGYEDGWKIEILGISIYNKTYITASITNLRRIQDEITDKVSSLKDYDNFASCGVDEEKNIIIVELVNNSKKEQKWFRENIYDSEYIKFKKGGPYYAY